MERAPEARYSNFALVTSAGRQILGNKWQRFTQRKAMRVKRYSEHDITLKLLWYHRARGVTARY
jgi:hypothetical protein